MRRAAFLIFAWTVSAWTLVHGQSPVHRPPRFEDYPATKIFAGKPAHPKLITPTQRRFRSMIRSGAQSALNVFVDHIPGGSEQDAPGPNFAGDMVFVDWGCGAACIRAAVVNLRTGAVYDPPLTADGSLAMPDLALRGAEIPEIDFRRNSRLMIIAATPGWPKPRARSSRFYFVWESDHWKLVFKEPLD